MVVIFFQMLNRAMLMDDSLPSDIGLPWVDTQLSSRKTCLNGLQTDRYAYKDTLAERHADKHCVLWFPALRLLSMSLTEENSGSGRPVWNIERSTDDPSVWSGDSLEVKVGSNLTLSCMIDALDLQYDVFRISLIQGDVLFPLVENGLVHSPFSNINRYSVTMNEDGGNGGARMTIHIEGLCIYVYLPCLSVCISIYVYTYVSDCVLLLYVCIHVYISGSLMI